MFSSDRPFFVVTVFLLFLDVDDMDYGAVPLVVVLVLFFIDVLF